MNESCNWLQLVRITTRRHRAASGSKPDAPAATTADILTRTVGRSGCDCGCNRNNLGNSHTLQAAVATARQRRDSDLTRQVGPAAIIGMRAWRPLGPGASRH